jgi:diguanylate cyclase (GGDEF)-like protein/PAS domain S-box-containing protein
MPKQPTHRAARTATWTTAGDQSYVRLTERTWQTALRSATLLEQAHDAIVGVSDDMTINVWNGGAERLYGFREPEATGASLTMLVPETQLESERRIWRRVLAGETVERDTQRLRNDGSLVEVSVLSSPVRDGSGAVVAACEIARDISARKVADAKLQHLASHDALTGLLNRRAFEIELERAVAFAKRYDLETALLIVDVDHFKLINDTYGHRIGDAALRRLAELMRGRLRQTDVIGRLGGDEFAIILSGVEPGQALRVAEEILDVVRADRTIAVNGNHVPLTVSAGVSRIGSDDASPGELLAQTDFALYQAKQAGRDRVSEAQTPELRLAN